MQGAAHCAKCGTAVGADGHPGCDCGRTAPSMPRIYVTLGEARALPSLDPDDVARFSEPADATDAADAADSPASAAGPGTALELSRRPRPAHARPRSRARTSALAGGAAALVMGCTALATSLLGGAAGQRSEDSRRQDDRALTLPDGGLTAAGEEWRSPEPEEQLVDPATEEEPEAEEPAAGEPAAGEPDSEPAARPSADDSGGSQVADPAAPRPDEGNGPSVNGRQSGGNGGNQGNGTGTGGGSTDQDGDRDQDDPDGDPHDDGGSGGGDGTTGGGGDGGTDGGTTVMSLQEGDFGPEVTELQDRLRQVLWYFRYVDVPAGVFDWQTESAVSTFQLWYGIRGDAWGVYGPNTRAVLEQHTSYS